MTIGEKLWRDAVIQIGALEILERPRRLVPELGREVIRRIDELVQHLTLDLDLYDQEEKEGE